LAEVGVTGGWGAGVGAPLRGIKPCPPQKSRGPWGSRRPGANTLKVKRRDLPGLLAHGVAGQGSRMWNGTGTGRFGRGPAHGAVADQAGDQRGPPGEVEQGGPRGLRPCTPLGRTWHLHPHPQPPGWIRTLTHKGPGALVSTHGLCGCRTPGEGHGCESSVALGTGTARPPADTFKWPGPTTSRLDVLHFSTDRTKDPASGRACALSGESPDIWDGGAAPCLTGRDTGVPRGAVHAAGRRLPPAPGGRSLPQGPHRVLRFLGRPTGLIGTHKRVQAAQNPTDRIVIFLVQLVADSRWLDLVCGPQ